jgi:hypothetical protein
MCLISIDFPEKYQNTYLMGIKYFFLSVGLNKEEDDDSQSWIISLAFLDLSGWVKARKG